METNMASRHESDICHRTSSHRWWWLGKINDSKSICINANPCLQSEAIAKSASGLPVDDPLRNFLTKMMVNTLYNSMLHPPLSYKGQKFQHRAADGGGNVSVVTTRSNDCS